MNTYKIIYHMKEKAMNQVRRYAIRIMMLADPRLPRGAMGYVDDLKPDCCPLSLRDRLDQLHRYVPDLVGLFRESSW